MNQSTLLHNISPDDFIEKLKEIIAETVNNISPQIEKRDELMTAEETALYFKKTVDTMANWVKKGYIQKYGIGDAVYFKRNEIENAVVPINIKK
jgi:hypothetical protein